MSRILSTGGVPGRYTPRAGTPWAGTPPGQVHPLPPGSCLCQVHPPRQVHLRQVHPPQVPPGRYTPQQVPPGQQCMLEDTGNKWVVCILLECILVLYLFRYVNSFLHLNHLIASRAANYNWQFGALPFGFFLSNLDTRDLETYPRIYSGHF